MNGHLAINTRLTGFAGLTALVGTRIFPMVMPDTPTFPAVTYHMLSSSSGKGALTDPPLMQAVFQITSWGKSMLSARSVADQVRAALDRYRSVTINGIKIDDCFYDGDVDLYDTDLKVFYVASDFKIFFRE